MTVRRRLRRQSMIGLASIGLAMLSCVTSTRDPALDWSLPRATSACVVTPDSTPPEPGFSLQPGRYELILGATRGTEAGQVIRGRLWLARTSAADRSPRTGESPAKPDTVDSPLYGATDVALESVGAAVTSGSNVPSPRSTDPIFPGVLVLMVGDPRQAIMLIGTDSNVRDGRIGLDGGGIGLAVTAAATHELRGRWGPWGLVANGSGYFCARSVQ